MKFKKFSALMVAAALMAGSLTATAFADDRPAPAESGSKEIDTLALQFVPSRDPEEIISGTVKEHGLKQGDIPNEDYHIKKE